MASERKSIEKISLEQIETTIGADAEIPETLRDYTPDQLATLEKKLVRKIDLRSLPILIILFLLNILDRNAIANARLGGLEKTLGIDDVQCRLLLPWDHYSGTILTDQDQTAVMVLWAGYISMMIPSKHVETLSKFSLDLHF